MIGVRGLLSLASLIGAWYSGSVHCTDVPGQAYEPDTLNWVELQAAWLPDLPAATPDEPVRSAYSERMAATFLDRINRQWVARNRCGTCHTSISYVMARPRIGHEADSRVWLEVRNAIAGYALEQVEAQSAFASFLAGPTAAALAVGDAAAGRAL